MLTRILLDTCTIRHFLSNAGPQIEQIDISSAIPRLWKYRFSIADGALAELFEQLPNLPEKFTKWHCKLGELDRLLDPKWPIFVGGRELSAIAGFQTDLGIDLRNSQIYHQSIWKLLRDSQSMGQIMAGIEYTDASGKRKKLPIDPAHIKSTLDNERQTWIDFIVEMQTLHRDGKADFSTLPKIEAFLRAGLGSAPTDVPDLATRLDAVTRLQAHFVHMAINQSPPFDPSTVKRRGDLFDWALLFALPLPSVIVTSDGKFIKRLRATKATDTIQIVSVEEFNDHARKDTLESLIAHHRTPEIQHQKWQEAAYFHWIKRGRPNGEALTDWLATEPIA